MKGPFKAIKISDDVWWVGAIDWTIRDFHGYSTSRGTTYNAYLIKADKITLMDTVKAPFREELISRISSVMDPGDIDYIISNHSEMDHSGCLCEMVRFIKPEKVFASKIGKMALFQNLNIDCEITPVKDGETLSLGNKTLKFIETRMLHWPDSMFSYLIEDEILFAQDGFGMHLACYERFDDQVDLEILKTETAKYYANIILLYSPIVRKLLEKVEKAGLKFKLIAPDHGSVWRKHINKIIEWYGIWSSQKPTRKAVITYDTMWNSTALMARAIADGIAAGGAHVDVMPLSVCHRSDIVTEILNAGALIVGSPTLNNNIFPTVVDTLIYLKGLKPANLIGAAFGSYGWSGESVKQIEGYLEAMKVEIVEGGIKVKYVPTAEDLQKCFELGGSVADRLKDLPANLW